MPSKRRFTADNIMGIRTLEDGTLMYKFHNPSETYEVEAELCECTGTDDDICIFTMERMNKSRLDFCYSPYFVARMPELCVLKLPCGHRFSALHLAFHFLQRHMRCPVCRSGVDEQASIRSMPYHLQTDMRKKVQAMKEQLANEILQQDIQAAMEIQDFEDII